MNKELEVNFLEPGLAIIISNLEEIEEKVQNKELTNLLDQLNEVEELEDLEKILNQLKDLQKSLTESLLKTNENEIESLNSLYTAINMANYLDKESFLFEYTNKLEELFKDNQEVSELDILDIFKEKIILKINEVFTEHAENFKEVFGNENEINKIIKIVSDENNINDLREANKLILNLLKIDNEFDLIKNIELLNIISNVEALISLIDIWTQFESDEEIEE